MFSSIHRLFTQVECVCRKLSSIELFNFKLNKLLLQNSLNEKLTLLIENPSEAKSFICNHFVKNFVCPFFSISEMTKPNRVTGFCHADESFNAENSVRLISKNVKLLRLSSLGCLSIFHTSIFHFLFSPVKCFHDNFPVPTSECLAAICL